MLLLSVLFTHQHNSPTPATFQVLAESSLAKFHRGLKKSLVAGYLVNVNRIVDEHLASLPATGDFEIFAYMKSLVHRIGFLCWVGPLALEPRFYTRLVTAFEVLDPESSFQNLASLATTLATFKRRERQVGRAHLAVSH